MNGFNPAVTRTERQTVPALNKGRSLGLCRRLKFHPPDMSAELLFDVRLLSLEVNIALKKHCRCNLVISTYRNSSRLWCHILFLLKSHKLFSESGHWTNQGRKSYSAMFGGSD